VKRRLKAAWLPASATIFCAWCHSVLHELTLAQIHGTGKTTLRCSTCGGHNVLPGDLLAQAENVPAEVDSDNPPGRAEAWERLVGNRAMKRAMEIAIAGRHTLTYVGQPDYGWDEVRDIMGEWATLVQRCPCGNYMRYNRVACSCTYDEIETHKKTRVYIEALESDLIVEALPPDATDFWDTGDPYAPALERIKDFRLSEVFDSGPRPEWVTTRSTGEAPSFRLLNGHKVKWSLTTPQLVSVQRVAHTIAGLEGSRLVESRHMAEALMFKAPLLDT
jgi:hypothetical protein